jgi:ribosome maturation factor RimP
MEDFFTELTQQIKDFIHPLFEEMRLDLVKLRIIRRAKSLLIEIITDHPSGGIRIDECAHVNRQVDQWLEAKGLITSPYTVTVASPGLDWPLATDKDFLRVINRKVKITLHEPLDQKIEYSGIVNGVGENGVAMTCQITISAKNKAKAQKELTIPLAKIKKAVQILA